MIRHLRSGASSAPRKKAPITRFCLTGYLAASSVSVFASPAHAADLPAADLSASPPPISALFALLPPKPFFSRIGVAGVLFDTGLAAHLGGAPIPGSGGKIPNVVTAAFEAGVFVTPNVGVSLGGGFPPVLSLRGTGTLAPEGTLFKAQTGLVTLTAHYHFDLGPVRPYVGGGLGYAIVFRDIAQPAVFGPVLYNGFAPVIQAGIDYALTGSVGVYVDLKKAWLSQDMTGFSPVPSGGVLPVYSRIRSDPVLLTGGFSYRF